MRFLAASSQIINLVHFMLVLHPTKLQNFQEMLIVGGFGIFLCVCVCVCVVRRTLFLPKLLREA